MPRFWLPVLIGLALQASGAVGAPAAEIFTATLRGTGSPNPSAQRNGPSTLVEAGGLQLAFDMGRGTTSSLARAGVPMATFDAHCITHMHSDHINGLPDLYMIGWIGTPWGGRTRPFVVYGPTGTQAMMEHLYATFAEDRRIRIEDEHYPAFGLAVDAHDFVAGVVYERDGVRVTAFPVFHGEHIQPAYGFRIDCRSHSVVLSGDTKYAQRVQAEATGADRLIHEVAAVAGDPQQVYARFAVYRTIMDQHASPAESGRLFANAHPKPAVYSHIVVLSNPQAGVPKATPQDIAEQTRRSYSGPLVVGEDMMAFRVTESGVAQILPGS